MLLLLSFYAIFPTAIGLKMDVKNGVSESSSDSSTDSSAVLSDFCLPWPPATHAEQRFSRNREHLYRRREDGATRLTRRRMGSSTSRRRARWTSASPSADRRRVRSDKKNAFFVFARGVVTVMGRSQNRIEQAKRDPSKQLASQISQNYTFFMVRVNIRWIHAGKITFRVDSEIGIEQYFSFYSFIIYYKLWCATYLKICTRTCTSHTIHVVCNIRK